MNKKERLLEWSLYHRCVVDVAEREERIDQVLDWTLAITHLTIG